MIDQRMEQEKFRLKHQRIEQDIYLRADHRHYNEHLLPQMPPLAEIPVVFHVVQDPDTEVGDIGYLTDQQIQEGLNLLNCILQGLDPCTKQTKGLNTDVQLCLAERTIFNGPTDGILRYNSNLYELDACTQEEELKNLIYSVEAENPYPSTDYLNVWLVDNICMECTPGSCRVAGFSSFPADHGTALDGLVIESGMWFNPYNPCEYIKVGAHELGHYLGLYHTFQGGCQNIDCHGQGDKVCDTPPDANYNIYYDHPCVQGGSYNSCTTDGRDLDADNPYAGTDVDDLSDNLMDYAPVECLFAFTTGQVERMHHTILEGRSSLLSSQGCQAPCPTPIDYTDLSIPDTLWVGEMNTMSVSIGSGIMASWEIWPYDWMQTGSRIDFIPESDGLVRVELELSNGNPNCTVKIRKEIIALCPLEVEISADQDIGLVPPGTQINYSISSPTHQSGYTYIWHVNGVPVDTFSSPSDFSHTIGEEEFLDVRLVVNNGYCQSDSDYIHHRSTDCREQKPGNVWPMAGSNRSDFGGYSMDFRNGIPERWDSITTNVNDFAFSAAYKTNGDLLFYFDGVHVTDRNGNIMVDNNSRSTFEFDESFAARAQHLIVPMPHSLHLFYVLKAASMYGNENDSFQAKYAIVDIRLNGGLGEVIKYGEIDPSRESYVKMDAIRDCNGQDWWVLMQNGIHRNTFFRSIQGLEEIEDNAFLLYKIDKEGIHFEKEFPRIIHGERGIFKFAPGGRRLLHLQRSDPVGTTDTINYDPAEVEIFKVDLINHLLIKDVQWLVEPDTQRLRWEEELIYSFSPSGNNIYTFEQINQVFQYRLNANGVLNSHRVNFDHTPWWVHRHIMPGPGRKMTGVINQPRSGVNYFQHSRPAFQVNRPDAACPGCGFDEIASIDTFYSTFMTHPINLIYDYTYGHPHGIYGVDTVQCGDTALVLTTDACPGREYIWSSKNGAEVVHEGETGELQIHFPYAGEEEFYLEKVTQCRTYFDTLRVTVLGDCKPECNPPVFSINDYDTVVCLGEPAWIEWSGDADSVRLINLDTREEQIISDRLLSLPNLQSRTCYELIFENNIDFIQGSCDTSYQFCVDVRPELDLEDRMDYSVCLGEESRLDITTDADRLDLINQASDYVLPDIQPGDLIGRLESDSCYTLRLQRDDGCDSYYDFCVSVHPVSMDTTSYQYCDGDEAIFEGMRISSDTFVCAHLTSSFACDSIVCADFIFRDEEVVSEEVSICSGDTLVLLGQTITEAGTYSERYARIDNCDSLHVVEVVEEVPPLRNIDIELCEGETTELYGESLDAEGQYLFDVAHNEICDSLISVQLMVFDTFYQSIEFELCDGDSIWVVDDWEYDPGLYTHALRTTKGCDSVIETRLSSVQDIDGPELSVLCEELLIEARQAVPENWRIEWSNGDTLRQTTYEQGGANEQVLLIREQDSTRSSCIREIAFSLPVLPEEEDLQAFLQDTQANQGELINLSIPLDPEIWQIDWSSSDDVQFSCDTCFTVELTMSSSSQISYVLTHKATGCQYEYHFLLELVDQKDMFLPSAFSPNDDGNNDQWEAFLQPYVSNILECRIYNRWGGQVAAWENVNSIQWDGTQNGQPLNPGVYVYFLRYQLENGEERMVKGDVTIAW